MKVLITKPLQFCVRFSVAKIFRNFLSIKAVQPYYIITKFSKILERLAGEKNI